MMSFYRYELIKTERFIIDSAKLWFLLQAASFLSRFEGEAIGRPHWRFFISLHMTFGIAITLKRAIADNS